jgi:leucyl aminopeptidase
MTELAKLKIIETSLEHISQAPGRVVVFVPESGKLDQYARRLNRLMRGALERFVESKAFSKLAEGQAADLAFPTGLHVDAVQVIRLDRRINPEAERRAGASIGGAAGEGPVLVLAGGRQKLENIAMGCLLKSYSFVHHKTSNEENRVPREITFMVSKPHAVRADLKRVQAVADGIYFARDLVNEPANVLTTTAFAERLEALRDIGLKVEVLDEDQLQSLGMRALLAVGHGSETPSKVVVMEWTGSGTEAPLALIGKGVVFDTGGISLKPAGGMEEMTMDMGGAGTVAGVMKALALRNAAANVVGVVGLVENMPDGRAQRPGDVVRSMKGDTVEVINTDAEGRLVLCDIMWYAQDRFAPRAMIDLATLTGAIVVALGHENAGAFSNDDALVTSFLAAAKTEGEGAWRMPLGTGYAQTLKSRVADVKNVGGRPGGAIIAAEFLQRFVNEDMPWIHLDIAGVASLGAASELAPKGATGWGVRALDRLVSDRFEG